VTEAGANPHATPDGWPEQDMLTELLKPFSDRTEHLLVFVKFGPVLKTGRLAGDAEIPRRDLGVRVAVRVNGATRSLHIERVVGGPVQLAPTRPSRCSLSSRSVGGVTELGTKPQVTPAG